MPDTIRFAPFGKLLSAMPLLGTGPAGAFSAPVAPAIGMDPGLAMDDGPPQPAPALAHKPINRLSLRTASRASMSPSIRGLFPEPQPPSPPPAARQSLASSSGERTRAFALTPFKMSDLASALKAPRAVKGSEFGCGIGNLASHAIDRVANGTPGVANGIAETSQRAAHGFSQASQALRLKRHGTGSECDGGRRHDDKFAVFGHRILLCWPKPVSATPHSDKEQGLSSDNEPSAHVRRSAHGY